MKRKQVTSIHLVSAILAILAISVFFSSSLIAEVIGDEVLIVQVKTAIFYTLPLMLILMPALGWSGKQLAGKSRNPLIQQKIKRMKLIAVNGLLLVVLAVLLYLRANSGTIDNIFLTLQIIELMIGGTNLYLLSLMVRDGLKLSGRSKKVVKTTI